MTTTLAPARPAVFTETVDPDLLEEGKVAHIAPAAKITEAYILGTPIEALCGRLFVPSRDPNNLPVCQECKERYEFMLVFRTDDSIRDDLG